MSLEQTLVDLRRLDLDLLFAGFLLELRHRGDELLDLAVGDVERVEDLGLGDALAPASTIRIASSVPATIRSSSSSSWPSSDGLTTKSPSSLPTRTAPTWLGDRDCRDRQRGGGAVHGEDVVGVDVVDRQRHRDELRLVVPALGEERADRAVDHARGQRRLLAGSTLAAEERAGDLARGVHALLDVDRQGKKVHVAQVAHGRGAQDHRVAGLDDDRAARLLGELAGLEGDLAAADSTETRLTSNMLIYCLPFGRPVGGHSLLQNSRSRSLRFKA